MAGGGGRQSLAGLAPRHVALDVLTRVLERKQPLDGAFSEAVARQGLSGRDRAFARLIVTTSLRHLGSIDAVLDSYLERALPHRAAAARHALRLSAAQLLFLDTPPHAAVATGVELVARHRRPDVGRFRGLVNAVLRGLSESGRDRLAALDLPRLDTPDWLWRRLVDHFGEAAARDIARAHAAIPPLDLSLRDPADRAWLAGDIEGARVLPTGGLRVDAAGDVTALAGYQDGAFWVQDAAASLPAQLLDLSPGEAVIDLCAAPGGKTLQLAAHGAAVTAVDISAERLSLLRDNLARTGLEAKIVEADARHWRPPAGVSAILLDAPCAATGTIRRHPDLPHIKDETQIGALIPLQSALLDNAIQMLAPGGTLIYAVCSLEPEEGKAQIEAALARHGDIARQPIGDAARWRLADAIDADGDLRILPCHWPEIGGLDGFFVARLHKPC